MKVREYLNNHQKTIVQTIRKALANNQLSHAYLLQGNPGTPLLQCALFMAKSIVCDDPIDNLACEECLTCRRIEDGNYGDIFLLNGKDATIKKEDIALLEERFAYKTPLESKGVMFYIINLVENMTIEAINALLKFLEEPSPNVYAFLTCENEHRVLPTILSRTQILRFKNIDLKELKLESKNLLISDEDSDILIHFYNDAELIKNVADSDDFKKIKSCFITTLNALDDNISTALCKIHCDVTPIIKSKESARLYIDMLALVFEDLINIEIKKEINLQSYGNILNNLAKKLPHLSESFIEIINGKSKIEGNINIPLLIDHLIIFITDGGQTDGRRN